MPCPSEAKAMAPAQGPPQTQTDTPILEPGAPGSTWLLTFPSPKKEGFIHGEINVVSDFRKQELSLVLSPSTGSFLGSFFSPEEALESS